MRFENYVFDKNRYNTPKPVFKSKEKPEGWKFLAREYKKPEEYINIPRDEILLGAENTDFDTAVTIPYPKRRRGTYIICGGQGSGKSVFLRSFAVGNIHYRFGHPLLIIDPKLDSHALLEPNTNPMFLDVLKKYKILPKKYNVMHVSPKFMDLDARGKQFGNEITMSLKDLINMDKDTRIATFSNLLGIETGEPAYAIVSEILSRDKIPLTVDGFWKAIDEVTQNAKEKDVRLKSDRLMWKFQNLVATQKISDNCFDYAEKMKEYGIVALEGSIADEDTIEGMVQGAFVNSAVYNVVNARTRTIRDSNCNIMNKIPYICMEEANTFAGKNGLSKGIMTALSTKYREIRGKGGIGSIVVTQFLHELAPKIVSEAEWIFTPKITHERDVELIKDRGSDHYLMDDMHFDPQDRPNDFIAYGRNGLMDYKRFVPLPCDTRMGSA